MSWLLVIFAVLFCGTHRCVGLSFPPQPEPHGVASAIFQSVDAKSILPLSGMLYQLPFGVSPSFLLASSEPPMVQTQSQQMSDAMVIKTMRGTQWRVIEDRIINDRLSFGPPSSKFFGNESPRYCKSLVTFGGFSGVDNKGTVGVEYFCDKTSTKNNEEIKPKKVVKGRWVTKPSRLARGSVQLSARWKVKCPEEGGKSVIYKGFIDADKIIGRNGKSVNAEMVGVILTGEEVNQEKVIGKFTADFVRQLTEEEEREIANNLAGGAIPIIESAPILLSSPQSGVSTPTTEGAPILLSSPESVVATPTIENVPILLSSP